MRRLVIVNKQILQRKCKYEILEITSVVDDVYRVENCKKGTEYLVTIEPDTCSCTAHRYYGNCKHIQAVKDTVREDKHMKIAIERTEDLMVLD